ncbi:Cytochrome-c peroxidase [Hymenobacter roseosalivarius DSM 11622]|uniref:Cytochrome-c peroxidase n=1 Tax=Hymenobacter roseosalivarius DSM 11622 TaxID=645990 RepID=A0A1W1W124_9BACT|nr:cytochrome c peroxidase [Hymenobacter roseosalivarius]SMB98804.1 Cytochrome-c peroxidase [Hymenobacter roseosalivarius DSM 11622]
MLQILFWLASAVFTAALLGPMACQRPEASAVRQGATRPTEQVLATYCQNLVLLDSALVRLGKSVETNAPIAAQRRAFRQARQRYKQVEFLAEYYQASLAKLLNGPAIIEVADYDQEQRKIMPEGLQVIETYFYPEAYAPDQHAALLNQLALTRSSLRGLRNSAAILVLTDRHVFDALRLGVFRVVTLGLPGFDTPASPEAAVLEAVASLQALRATLAAYAPALRTRDAALAGRLDQTLTTSLAYLKSAPTTDFDQLIFLTKYANPLSQQLRQAQLALGIPEFTEARALRASVATLFDSAAFNPDYFAPQSDARTTPAQVALGQQLFFDPALSGNGSRSCASCHQPARGFAENRTRSVAFAGKGTVSRNAPTLLNAALQRTQYHDGRLTYLEDQAADVLTNPTEMHGSLVRAAALLRQSPAYQVAFAQAFETTDATKATITENQVQRALASYVRSLVRLNSPFDRYVRGETAVLDAAARRGFNVYMGKGKCGTCHFMPLFNGNVAPTFERTETEILGVPAQASLHPKTIDPDPGKFRLQGIEWQRHAFKTPTLRNIALTAPYMHNGAYQTLEEVIEFYDRGGGAGLGLDVPNQTLPPEKLNLTKAEKSDLLAFMHALTDTTHTQKAPQRLLAFPAGMARLNKRVVGGNY